MNSSNGRNQNAGKSAASGLTGGSEVGEEMQQMVDPGQAEEFMQQMTSGQRDGVLS